eukprot:COSAG04_NODE_3917_length_2424_cov_139.574194_1_plen_174_part_00
MLLSSVAQTRPAVAQHQIELGCLSLAVAELRTMDSCEWLSVSRSPLGLPTSLFNMLGVLFTSLPDPGTPAGLLEVCLDALTAYERAGASGDTGALVLYNVMCVLFNGRLSGAAARGARPGRARRQRRRSQRRCGNAPATIQRIIKTVCFHSIPFGFGDKERTERGENAPTGWW